MKSRRIEIWLPENLYWKLEENRVKKRIDSLSELIIDILREKFDIFETEPPIATKSMLDELIEKSISKYFPSARGECYRDLKAIIQIMLKDGVNRKEAVNKRAKEKKVFYQTVLSNITRGQGIKTDKLDQQLELLISELKNKLNSCLEITCE